MKKIALSGKSRSGKDTVAKIISMYYKQPFIVSFAEKLKGIYSHLYSIPLYKLDIPELKETYRPELIKFAKHLRNYDEDIFINPVLENIQLSEGICDIAIITDVRFKKEAEALKKKNFSIVRIKSDKYNKEIENEESESQLNDYSFTAKIHNPGSITGLTQTIEQMIHDKIL